MKTGSKYYGFKNWDENRVKRFREKEPENLGMKTWTHTLSHQFYIDPGTYQNVIIIFFYVMKSQNQFRRSFEAIFVKQFLP